MSKLVASKGVIEKVTETKIGPINVVFKRSALNPDGSLGEVKIFDNDGSAVYMTFAQGASLASEIIRRTT